MQGASVIKYHVLCGFSPTESEKDMERKVYKFIKTRPVAKFFYKGRSHTHPVRRTVLVTELAQNRIVGYEIREGANVRPFEKAPIKSFLKGRIAKIGQVDRRRKIAEQARSDGLRLDRTTLQRVDFIDLVKEGV